MTQTTGYACPRCQAPLEKTANFCANCGADISGVWGPDGEPLGKTIAVEINPTVDTLAQLLTKATLGDYDIYGELGRGGMAAVYLGLDLALNRKVAIKTMLPELVSREGMVERFKREAQTAAALSHPHIIQIFTVKQTKELVYFVMKFIEGRSLESVITEKGQLSVDMTRMVLSQVASALAYAHRKHVVHRDIKPANIMIDEDGWAIVTDFGIAKVQEAQNLTATGTAIGTPHYMSPEQFHNKAITGQSDQYSLGIVAYEMLMGKKPFDGATYAEIITQHLFEQPPDLRAARPDIPETVANAVKRMLAKDPAERFPDLDAVAHELGVPQKTDGVNVRTEMISLAKNGPQKKVRMSVPISPIPASKKAEDLAAATVLEPRKPTRPRPQVQPAAAAGSNRGLIAAVAVAALLGGGGFAAWKITRPEATPATQLASQPQTPPTRTPDPRADSPAVTPSGQAATGSEAPAAQTQAPAATETKTAAASVATNPPPPSPARVTVGNVPSNGVITVDGRRQSGRAFSLRAGEHTIQIRAAGFEPMTRRLNLAAGEIVNFDYDLRPVMVAQAPQTKTAPAPSAPANTTSGASASGTSGNAAGLATVQIVSKPPATVYINNDSKGERRAFAEQLTPGTHALRFEKGGFVTKDTVITVVAGQTVRITIELTPRQ